MEIDPNELSFAGFAEEENEKIEEARKKAKEAPLDLHLRKIIIDYIYNNLINVINGQKIDHSLADINPECQDIIEALSAFEREEGFGPALEQHDIFEFLKDYNKVKGKFKTKQKLSEEKLEKIFIALGKKGYDKQYAILALNLDILSEVINKDVIKNMIARNNLEKKATLLTQNIISLQGEALIYTNVWSEINEMVDKYGSLTKIKIDAKDQPLVDKIKTQLGRIVDMELQRLVNSEYEYENMIAANRENFKNKLERIKTLAPEAIFDVNNFGFIGLLLEKRQSTLAGMQQQYEDINKRLGNYIL